MSYYNDQQSRIYRAFTTCSSTLCVTNCHCGRVHFVSHENHGDYNDGELDELKAKAASQPDKYIDTWEFDTIDSVYIDGKTFVVDCKCGEAERYAKWIERHARGLAGYLVLYFRDVREKATRDAKEADGFIGELTPPFAAAPTRLAAQQTKGGG